MVKAAVEAYFKRENITYEPFDENNVARTGFGVKAKFGRVDVLFLAYDNNLIIHTFIPLKAEEEERAKVGEFLLRANDGLKTGCFDFNFANGRISYRVSIFCGKDDFFFRRPLMSKLIMRCLSASRRFKGTATRS